MSPLRTTLARDYANTLREPGGALKYPFFTPGSEQYSDVLWDWDSWTSNWSLRQIALEQPDPATVLDQIRPYERGCILNFLTCPSAGTGYLPICIERQPLTWSGLVRYGLDKDAKDLAEKTVRLFTQDLERHGALHEYYQPENGQPILNRGFQNWNYLVLNMLAWLEGRPVIREV